MIETWRLVWRRGFAPGISTEGLLSLRTALVNDDKRLIQGGTTSPPPLLCLAKWPCEATCVCGWPFWRGGENPAYQTVEEVEEAFARLCSDADQRMGGRGVCRWVLNFWDDTPRYEARRELLAEVNLALAGRIGEHPDMPAVVDLSGVKSLVAGGAL